MGTSSFSVCTGVFKWVFVLFCFVSYLEVQTATVHWAFPRTLGTLLEAELSYQYLMCQPHCWPRTYNQSKSSPLSLTSPWVHFRSNITAQPQVAWGILDALEYPSLISSCCSDMSKPLCVPPRVYLLRDGGVGFLWDLRWSKPGKVRCSSHSSQQIPGGVCPVWFIP